MEAFSLGNVCVTYLSQGMYKHLILLTFRRAHNPKVAGSNPAPATKEKPQFVVDRLGFLFLSQIFSRNPFEAQRCDNLWKPSKILIKFSYVHKSSVLI